MSLNLERHLRSKLGRWRENEYSNAATMEDWRNERENMQKVRHPHWRINRPHESDRLCNLSHRSSSSHTYEHVPTC